MKTHSRKTNRFKIICIRFSNGFSFIFHYYYDFSYHKSNSIISNRSNWNELCIKFRNKIVKCCVFGFRFVRNDLCTNMCSSQESNIQSITCFCPWYNPIHSLNQIERKPTMKSYVQNETKQIKWMSQITWFDCVKLPKKIRPHKFDQTDKMTGFQSLWFTLDFYFLFLKKLETLLEHYSW